MRRYTEVMGGPFVFCSSLRCAGCADAAGRTSTAGRTGGARMPSSEDEERVQQGLCPDGDTRRTESSVWAYYHKPIIVMVIGVLVVGAGGVVSLVQRSVEGDLSPAIVPVCLTIGMMFIVVGLVWLPILRDKQKRLG
ncbi:phosphoinositide-interacting protein-like [Denticeps clupeoides]|uniref:phosphoinositide-interacting protein-like n=1 Tax=Denticeps clupeoides TaxID=299321 RepID=UPI0010A3A2EC|nr:phosphoinositide-interacting protein-like [Denticeps clupeoides]XP_028844259.1 phosphoinositide-interacting protein-like [Denticeps clupeoides]